MISPMVKCYLGTPGGAADQSGPFTRVHLTVSSAMLWTSMARIGRIRGSLSEVRGAKDSLKIVVTDQCPEPASA